MLNVHWQTVPGDEKTSWSQRHVFIWVIESDMFLCDYLSIWGVKSTFSHISAPGIHSRRTGSTPPLPVRFRGLNRAELLHQTTNSQSEIAQEDAPIPPHGVRCHGNSSKYLQHLCLWLWPSAAVLRWRGLITILLTKCQMRAAAVVQNIWNWSELRHAIGFLPEKPHERVGWGGGGAGKVHRFLLKKEIDLCIRK